MLWLIPFDSIKLPLGGPVDATLDRPLLVLLAGIWLFAAERRRQPRPARVEPDPLGLRDLHRRSPSSACSPTREALVRVGGLDLAIKQIALLASYGVFFALAAAIIRPSEVPKMITAMLCLACFTAVAVIIEYRLGHQPLPRLDRPAVPRLRPAAGTRERRLDRAQTDVRADGAAAGGGGDALDDPALRLRLAAESQGAARAPDLRLRGPAADRRRGRDPEEDQHGRPARLRRSCSSPTGRGRWRGWRRWRSSSSASSTSSPRARSAPSSTSWRPGPVTKVNTTKDRVSDYERDQARPRRPPAGRPRLRQLRPEAAPDPRQPVPRPRRSASAYWACRLPGDLRHLLPQRPPGRPLRRPRAGARPRSGPPPRSSSPWSPAPSSTSSPSRSSPTSSASSPRSPSCSAASGSNARAEPAAVLLWAELIYWRQALIGTP